VCLRQDARYKVLTKKLHSGTHVIKFFANWCGPCKLYAPAFERAAALSPDVNFHSVDVDQDPAMKEEFGVLSIPTTVIVKDGVCVKKIGGVTSTRQLVGLVEDVLSSEDEDSAEAFR
jgi:thioredoxin 1